MTEQDQTVESAVRAYWNTRAEGYSVKNNDELAGETGDRLKIRFAERLGAGRGVKALDVGCGPGIFAITLASLGCETTAVDLSPGMLSEAKANAAARGLTVDFREGNAETLPFADETFDIVVSRYLIWNLPHPEAALADWARVLKKGGKLCFEDGNHYRWLFDSRYAKLREQNGDGPGHAPKYLKGVSTEAMTDIAETLPLSGADRPGWDLAVLAKLGLEAELLERKTARLSETGEDLVTDFVVLAVKR